MEQSSASANRILIVDDEEGIRALLRIWLERAGFVVFETENGLNALAICKKEGCSLVISDLFMDQKDGLETIAELREQLPDVKLIAMSGGATNHALHMLPVAQALGAFETLSKPLDRTLMIETVNRLLGLSAT